VFTPAFGDANMSSWTRDNSLLPRRVIVLVLNRVGSTCRWGKSAPTLPGNPTADSGLIAYPRSGITASAGKVASHLNVQLDIEWTFHLRIGHEI
jgi:hypothetical protein